MSRTIVELLKSQRSNTVEAESRRKEIMRIRSCSMFTSPSYGERPKGGTHDPHAMENRIVSMVDMIKSHEERIQAIEAERFLVYKMIYELSSNEQSIVIEDKYFSNMTAKEISLKLGTTESWVYKLHNTAIKNLKKIREKNPAYAILR